MNNTPSFFDEKFLYKEFDTLSKNNFFKEEITTALKNSLNAKFKLRPYQVEAFKRYFYYVNGYEDRHSPSHLLFNMATGSGKTLIMAGLILYLYEHGYRNFLFFVHSNNIIDKTKDNFLNKQSSKYLFSQKITLNDALVDIKSVDNFEGVFSNNINICFTTIQKLHSDLGSEKENSITYEDFENKKVVLISDEAHHIQVKTKQKVNPGLVSNWENTVEQIFNKNSKNMLLEFTATLDYQDKSIIDKYYSRAIYRYDLKNFRDDGYSKDIDLLRSEFAERERMLQAIILNQYRQEVAGKYNINLKPVILFKAKKTIEESQRNQKKFNDLIDELSVKDIQHIRNDSELEVIKKAFNFFSQNNITNSILVQKLKTNFSPTKCLNVNKNEELISQQNTLNSLEDEDNQIRAIFAVHKLNEGWDVLNLFDIVRLYETRDSGYGKIGKATLAEAQLIGRGARYFPFTVQTEEELYIRKFDKDLEHELRILEELHYHSVNDSKYISEIREALIMKGLMDDNEVEKELKLKDDFKKKHLYKHGSIYLNKQIENKNEDIKSFADLGVRELRVEYKIASGIGQEDFAFNKDTPHIIPADPTNYTVVFIGDIDSHIVRSALAKNTFYSFANLKKYFPNLKSINEFITNKKYLARRPISYQGLDVNNISNFHYLKSILKFLSILEKEIKENTTEYKGSKEFRQYAISKKFFDKVIKLNRVKNRERLDGQEAFVANKKWYAFNANYGTSEEKEFVKTIDKLVGKLKQNYHEIYLLRNELHVKIYNFSDGRGFAPDFLLFLKRKNGDWLTYQIFMEVKGKYLMEEDKWKSDFLAQIKEKFKGKMIKFSETKKYKITGARFYNSNEENEFMRAFEETLKDTGTEVISG